MRKFHYIFMIAISLFFSSCVYNPHYICEYKSQNNLYRKIVKGDVFDKSFSEYTINDTIFVLLPESTVCYTKSKKKTEFRFLFQVLSKNEDYEYKIDSIYLILDGEKHDIYEYLTEYYPYDNEMYTAFSKSPMVPYYYYSNYHLGFVMFPTPKNKNIEVMVTVFDNESKQHTFVYKYIIKFSFDLFISTV